MDDENTGGQGVAVKPPTQAWAIKAFEQSVEWGNVAEHLRASGDPLWMLAESASTMLRVFANAAGGRDK